MQDLDIALSLATFLSLREKLVLRNRLDSLSALSVLSIEELSHLVGRPVTSSFWTPKKLAYETERVSLLVQKSGVKAVLVTDGDYPALLRESLNAPYMLFYRGNLEALHKRCISMVGSRSVCEECAKAAQSLAYDAASDDCTVVSGNADGIDTFSHRGALMAYDRAHKGSTVAVLPCGIDQVFPSSNTVLAKRILESGGALVSEYGPGQPIERWRFVQRNRIIAALSPVTVVVQAPPGSGALITADFAVDFNRELVFHSSCFCEQAKKMPSRKKNAGGKKTRTSQSFIDSGAPKIDSYEDLLSVLKMAPGEYASELF